MSKTAYIVGNLISENTPLTSDSEDAVYTLANLYDRIAAKPFRWTSAGGGWVEIDLLATSAYDTLSLIGHNFTSAASITVKVGSSSPPATVVGTPVWRDRRMWINLGARTERYVRVTASDPNLDVEKEIGELVLGSRVEITRARRWGRQAGLVRSDIALLTQRLVPWVYSRGEINQLTFNWRLVGAAELAELEALDQAVTGSESPFLLIPNTAAAAVFYGRKESSWLPEELAEPANQDVHDYAMTFLEDSLGRRLT